MKKILVSFLISFFCLGLGAVSAQTKMEEADVHGPVKTMEVVKKYQGRSRELGGIEDRDKCFFSKEGLLTQRDWKSDNTSVSRDTTEIYDSKERIIERKNHLKNSSQFFRYDDQARSFERTENGEVTRTGTLGDKGRILTDRNAKKATLFEFDYAYDERGNQILYVMSKDGNPSSTSRYRYDEKNCIISSDNIASFGGGPVIKTKYSHIYNEDGFLIEMRDENPIFTEKFIYESKDFYGNWTKRIGKDSRGVQYIETRTITYYDDEIK